ncbi:MAG: aminotransferase class IV [Chitinophagaceae bacterium]|nr:aminotransferase class IV [Chitinophagaceae bacterium]
MEYININGKIVPANEPVLLASNRGYRYGDGLFETMKVVGEQVSLVPFHFERLFSSLSVLQFDVPKLFTAEKLQQEVMQLCQRNNCTSLARVRLSVSRGNGGLYDADKTLQYLIECWPLPELVNRLNENGLVIDIYPDARKSCDKFSSIKSANFLPYSLAAHYAKANKYNDCLVLNTQGSIADSTIANVFIIKEEVITTPALTEGCVNGVMRRHLIGGLKKGGYFIRESAVSIDDLLAADEVFLSNAIQGIRWVRQCRDSTYRNSKTVEIFTRFVKTISS